MPKASIPRVAGFRFAGVAPGEGMAPVGRAVGLAGEAEIWDDGLGDDPSSLADLVNRLLDQGVDVRTMPLVLQYNKQDLPPDLVLAPPELDDVLNFRGCPSVPAARSRAL